MPDEENPSAEPWWPPPAEPEEEFKTQGMSTGAKVAIGVAIAVAVFLIASLVVGFLAMNALVECDSNFSC